MVLISKKRSLLDGYFHVISTQKIFCLLENNFSKTEFGGQAFALCHKILVGATSLTSMLYVYKPITSIRLLGVDVGIKISFPALYTCLKSYDMVFDAIVNSLATVTKAHS